jgi:predicted ferric reductase
MPSPIEIPRSVARGAAKPAPLRHAALPDSHPTTSPVRTTRSREGAIVRSGGRDAHGQTELPYVVDVQTLESVTGADTALAWLAGTVIGAVVAVVVVPTLLPDLAASLLGDQPKAFWYLSRSAGIVAYLALWLSMVLGLSLTNRFGRLWAGGPALADVHQFSSLLALSLVMLHVGVLLGDAYTGYRLDQLLMPFASTPYEPFWVGLGQVALYLALLVTFSFYLRRQIGIRTWRLLHYGSFALFVLAAAHGLGAGTDSGTSLMRGLYLFTGGSVVFLTCYRVMMAIGRRVAVGAAVPSPDSPRGALA